MPSSIKALDASVVNKIAAGEIIISPVNALKEMMENSIDAGGKNLDILVREGGAKLLQITDDGSGVNKDDLRLLCERFTTSKLSKFEDLESIATYGFRGEALASISHIARLTVTTKTSGDKCAWKVSYAEGKMLGEPKPVAGKTGTVILVEDLFYNMPSRLRTLRSPSEEYAKIVDVIGRYAVHSEGIGFSCKKFGDSQFTLTVRSNSTIEERIKNVFGNSFTSNSISFQMNAPEGLDVLKVTGRLSNIDFNSKKSITPVFFINNRLVTCNPLGRALRQVYSNYLPKGNKPFIYLSIFLNPKTLDVNIHPTKREVRFLHQDEIIEKITYELNDQLSKIDSSRTFKTSSILTGKPFSTPIGAISKANDKINGSQPRISGHVQKNLPSGITKRYENKLVRTDASQAKITSFLQSSQPTLVPSQVISHSILSQKNGETDDNARENSDYNQTQVSRPKTIEPVSSQQKYTISTKERVNVNLTSIKRLREAVDSSTHRDLTDIFANLTYVGVVDDERRLATIQHDLKLFLVDYGAVCYELFYQICLTDFANYGKIILQSDIEENLTLVNMLAGFEHLDKKSIESIVQKLWDMRDMLKEYFSIDISIPESNEELELENVRLITIPLLLKGYMPSLAKLPFFIYRLGTKVNWEEEEPCLDEIIKQIALLYIPEIIKRVDTFDDTLTEEEKVTFVTKSDEMSSSLENVLFPCIKRRFLAPRQLLKDVIEIANLPGLYKVFERC